MASRFPLCRIIRAGLAATLLAALIAWPARAHADGDFVVTPPPQTGAYSAQFVEDRGHVSVIDFSGNYDKNLPGGSLNGEARAVVAREFYRTHADEYDFLVVFSAFEFDTGEALAFHLGVQNGVEGIGVPIFDNSAAFGSDGKLQGYIDMAALERYEIDPLNPDFELVLQTLSHEILHQWAAKVRFREADGSLSDALLGKDGAHWSFLLDSNASVEYGARWRDNGDGSFTATAVRKFFSPLDLYLMGLYRADEVPPLTLIDNPEIDRERLPQENVTIEGVPRQITIDDIIAAEGERVPAAADAQTEFRIGFILLKGPTQVIPQRSFTALDAIRQAYGQRFAIATGGRALVHVYPRAVYLHDAGAPVEVAGSGDPRPGASLADGLAWLRGQQHADGYWSDKQSTRLRDTVVVLRTLLAVDDAFNDPSSAIAWIDAHEAGNSDFLARQVALLGDNPALGTLDRLLALQNVDGGWGLSAGFDSDPLDTALAILALLEADAVPAAVARAVQFLLHSQNADGGWGNAVGTESRTAITATALQALRAANSNTAAIDDALALLKSRQNVDGGFGDSPSTVYDTALALQVFMDFERVEWIDAPAAAGFLLGRQLADGSWGGSTYATALTLAALKRFNFANWQIAPRLAIEPAAPRDGERVRILVTITNDSNLFTPQTTLAVYDGNPLDGGVAIGEPISIPLMAPGSTLTLVQYWDSFDQAGDHQLYAVADPDGLFTELSEGDNQGSVDVTVQAAPDGVDLEVVETDIAVLPARPNRLPSNLGIVGRIRNSGLADASQVRVVLFAQAAGGSAAEIVDETRVDMPNRASVVVNFSALLEVPGETVYTLRIDPDDEVAEVSEANNEASVSVATDASVDLEIGAADIGSDVNPAFFGESIEFRVAIHNRGTRDTPTTRVRYLVSNGIDSRQLAVNNLQLAAGESTTQTIGWQVDLHGALQFTAEVDFDALVAELDEANNLASYALPVENRVGANLVVSHRELNFSPEVANEGGAVNIAAAILNNGSDAAAAFEVAFYLGDPAAGGVRIDSPQRVDGLAAGARAFVTVDWQPVPSAGDKLIYVLADIDDTVPESRDDDNSAFDVLSVLSLPDLAVSASDIDIDPRFPSAGAEVALSVRVANLGDQAAADILVRVYDGDPGSGGRLVGEQVLASLDGAAAASLEFALQLGPQLATSSFVVEVDPLGEIAERNRANNSATRQVAVQRGDIYASNLYLSPNADGVQDSTEVVFLLEEPADVVLQVVDGRDRVVREYRDDLDGVVQGSVTWDGLDARGRLVADGDYRLRLVKTDGGDIAELLVQVDTNRSSLLRALNSEFEFFNNLTCELDTVYAVNVLESEEQLVIEAGDNDIFSLNSDGSEARVIIPSDWFVDTEPYYTQTSRDGSVIAFTRYDPSAPFREDSPLWVADGDGENRRQVIPQIEDGWVLSDDGATAYSVRPVRIGRDEDMIVATDIATGDEILHVYDYYEVDSFEIKPQPGGNMVAFLDEYFEDSGPAAILIDGLDDSFQPVVLGSDRYWRNDFNPSFEWSPDGRRIAATSDYEGAVFIFDNQGGEIARIDLPTGSDNARLDSLAWSSNGAEIALVVRSFDPAAGDSGIYLLDVDARTASKVADIAYGEGGGELEFSYHVSTWDGSDWVERGVLHYRRFYREQQLDLSAHLPDADGEYKVRIRQVGKEAAHVESVALLAGGRRAIPSSAVKLEQSLVASLVDRFSAAAPGEDALASVSHNDYEVLDLFESEMQVEWQDLPRTGRVVLALNAREESLSKLNTRPFTYAGDGDGGFAYVLAANAPLVVDGELSAADGLDAPLFRQFSRPGTGHPAATVDGYLGSDSDYLYGALDFTVDNTIDGDLDWASMRVMTAQGWREFRVTEKDNRYGRVNFTRTAAVPFAHKYYEFRVPLAELDRQPGDTVMVSFQGYGTAALVVDGDDALPYDGDLLWPPGDRMLFYDAYGEGKWSIDLNADNRVREAFGHWPGGSNDISEPFFTDSGRKLLFRSERANNDPTSICYDTGSDLWSYESLLNLVVDLRATRSNSAGGIILGGTVADLNFERYTLEYASRDAADNWLPIFSASTVPVVDGRFTTWAPPAVGKYLLRLTAWDRAGNSRSVVRQASWGLNSAITDLALAPEYISPNGDGVQDEARLHYRVLEPVHLDFSIYNQQGDVVRTFTRDHGVIGTGHDLVWDGRNSQGLPVADGRYRVAVLGFEFFVNVDSTAPQILGFDTQSARRTKIIGDEAVVVAEPGLDWSIAEASTYSIEIETGDGAQPSSWRPFAQPIVRDNDPQTADVDEDDLGLTIAQFVDRAFRLQAADVAGNRSTLAIPPGEQQLILTGKVREDYDALEASSYQVIETVAAPLANAVIEYREAGGSGDWLEAEIDAANIAEGGIDFSWLPAEATFGKRFVMRVRATDINAQDFYSNEKQLSYQGVLFQYRNLFTSAVLPSATLNGLDAEGVLSVLSAAASSKQVVVQSLRIDLESSTDPRYAAPVTLLNIETDVELQPGITWTVPYRAANLSGCQKYRTSAHLTLRITDTAGDTPSIGFTTVTLASQDVDGRVGEVEMPCLSVDASVSYPVAQNCDAPAGDDVELTLRPASGNEFGLKLLTLYTRAADGSPNVFFNVNKPLSGQVYRYPVDPADHAEGVLGYYAELTNDANQVRTESLPVLIDITAPSTAITYPQEGQLVCGIPRQRSDGGFESVVDIDVDIDDPTGDRSGDDPLNPFADKLEVEMQYARGGSTVEQSLLLGEQRRTRFVTEHGVQGKLAELVDANGEYRLLVQATDLAGNRQCLVRSFSVDGIVEHSAPRADSQLFSPNDDGVLDSFEFSVGVDEAVNLDVAVYAAVIDDNGRVVADGERIRRLADQLQLLPGSEVLSWDGRDAGGGSVADGLYLLVLDYQDACGNRSRGQLAATVDRTPPAASIDYPRAGDPLTSVLEVLASVDDPHLAGYLLELGQGADPERWLELAGGSRAIDAEVVAVWNTVDLSGPYTLRLTARDRAGNLRETVSSLELVERSSLFDYLEAVPLLISPNQDNRREAAGIRVGLESDSLLSVDIVDANDVVVRGLASARPFAAGAANLSWDGRNDAGDVVADGSYRVALDIALAANPAVRESASLTLVVDATAPQVELSLPGEFASGDDSVIGTISDSHLLEYRIELTSTPAAPQWQGLASGNRNQSRQLLATLGGLEEGDYALRVTATDEGESVSQRVFAFNVDNTPPKIAISAPQTGSFIGIDPAAAAVSIDIVEDRLQSYTLDIAAAAVPGERIELASGSELPVTNPVAVVDSAALDDGPHLLRLVAADAAGNRATVSLPLTIDGSPPFAGIAAPAAGAYVTGPLAIRGSATDANLLSWRLEIAPGTLAEASRWSPLGESATAVDNARLLDWNSLPPDGAYVLRLEVGDKAQNIGTDRVAIIVDTTPPAAPAGLVAAVEAQSTVRLDWQAGSEPDIAGYRVYRDGKEISAGLVADTGFLDQGVADGRLRYSVRAEDHAGWLGEASPAVEVLLDTTPPTAKIFAPRDNSLASGVVALKGTANSADDFREYRVYLRRGQAANWQLLAQSPVPVIADLLHELDTLDFAEGESFSVKLEAEDINGNVGEALVNLSVDNQAPAAPTGLVAVGNDSDVSLSWNPNGEADLLGYLLYRGDRLANAIGAVIGDLRPYALSANSFVDLALADGFYAYTVAAIDRAGNLSEASLVSEVLIDTSPPAVVIAAPSDSDKFGSAQYVTAVSEATDIARVQFQYKAAADSVWLDLGALDEAEPWAASLDPLALNLAQGAYQLRAIATDFGNRVDPAPQAIVIYYTDVTRPAAVQGLLAQAVGAEVYLSWEASTESDLAGYHVERIDADGEVTRLTSGLLTATQLVDTVVDDGLYDYRVLAADTTGNLGDPSNPATARVHTPLLQQPYTPLSTPGPIELAGSGVPLATVGGTLDNVDGVQDLPPANVDGLGRFSLPGLDLALGDNRLSVRLTDSFGNVSRAAGVSVTHGLPPAAPVGLAANVAGYDVELDWTENSEANLLGYRVFRAGESLLDDYRAQIFSVDATQNSFGAFRAVDGNSSSYWYLSSSTQLGFDPALLTLTLDEVELVTRIEVEWWSQFYRALDYDIEARFGDAWVTLLRVRDAEGEVQTHQLEAPYYTGQLRLRLRRALVFESEVSRPVRLAEVRVEARQLLEGTGFGDTTLDGEFDYQVSAVNSLGFEGARSAVLAVVVGDVTAPDEVQLAAEAIASDVHLDWLPSASSDVASYELFRDGELLAVLGASELAYVDADLANGSYAYVVYAIDGLGLRSMASNQVVVDVAVGPLPAPQLIGVSALDEGASLDLAWQPLADGIARRYRVLRALQAGGPYSEVADADASGFRDRGLDNGVEYFYRVAALDAAGNPGLPSNELSGVPQDLIEPVTVMLFPGAGAAPYAVFQPRVDIYGQSEAGARIRLLHDGIPAAAAIAGEIAASESYPLEPSILEGSIAPDGRTLLQVFADRTLFTNLDDGSSGQFVFAVNRNKFVWSGDGSHFAYVRPFFSGGVYRNTVEMQTVSRSYRRLTNPFGGDVFDYPALNSDASRFAAIGRQAGGTLGLWVKSVFAFDWALLKASSAIQGDSLQWSPDDRYLAYRVLDPGGTHGRLEIVDVDSGAITVVDDRADTTGRLYWSADSRALYYSRSADANADIWRYRLDPGLAEAVTAGDGDFGDAHEFIGAGKLLAIAGGSELVMIDLDRGVVDTLYRSGGIERGSLHKTLDGRFAFVDTARAELVVFTPAGGFRFDAVPLRVGDNRFTATASDDNSQAVPSQNALTIAYDISGKPDLSIDSSAIGLLPAVPLAGSPAAVRVEVDNRGGGTAYGALLSLVATDAQGFSQVLLGNVPIDYLYSGTSTSFTADWTPPLAGAYRLLAIVDTEGQVDEGDETNNSATLPVLVAAGPEPLLNLSTDRGSYAADETVVASLELSNAGNAFFGSVEIVIEDELGFSVDRIAAPEPVELAYGAREQRRYSWNTGSIFAGNYRVHAWLYAADGSLVAEQLAAFEIGASNGFGSRVFSDLDSYPGNSDVLVTASVSYDTGNALFGGAAAHLRIVDADAVVVAEREFEIGSLLPGATQSFELRWNTALSMPGDYALEFDVIRDQQRIAAAAGGFSVVGGAVGLEGELALDVEAPAAGEPQTARFAVSNINNLPLGQLPVRVRLIDPATQSVLEQRALVLDIAPGATVDGSEVFATDGLRLGTHSLLLEALVEDAAGAAWVKLAGADFALRDRGLPAVQVLTPRANGYLRGDAQVVVSAIDDLSFVDRVEIRVDGGGWRPMALADAGRGEYRAALGGLADGNHRLQARATDAWNNTASSGEIGFVVDSSAPLIRVDGVLDAGVYNAAVTPTVAIAEANPAATYITRDGLPFVSGATLAADGSYQLQVYASDQAGNESQLVLQFVIDRLVPLVEILGVSDGAVYAAGVTPTITISDANLRERQISLNGQPYASATPIVAEGDYYLEALATDAAGNTGRAEARFRIDLSAPRISVSGVADGAHYNTDVAALIDVEDAGAVDLSSTLNGEPYVGGEPIVAPGSYLLSVIADDEAGNTAGATIAFVIDRSAPLIEIDGVVDDGYYAAAAPRISVDEAHLHTLEIDLDGAAYLPQTPVHDEGGHLLRVVATDLAGNRASRELFFTIDSTPPLVVVDTPLHGETLFTRNTDVIGRSEPFARVDLEIGAARYATSANAAGEFEFNGVLLEQGFNTLYLAAVDRAGNAGPLTEVAVQVVSGDIPGEHRAAGGVLVWLPLDDAGCDAGKSKKSKKSKKTRKSKKSKKSAKSARDDCHAHRSGEMLGHQGEPAMQVIEAALDAARRDYLLVHGEDEFFAALRSQRYGSIVLLDWHKYYCRKDDACDSRGRQHAELKLDKDRIHEIGALVASGSGLLLIKTRPDHDKYWQTLGGFKAGGELPNVTALELLGEPLADPGPLAYNGRAIRIEPAGAAAIALAGPHGEVAMTASEYAGGRVMVLGFNPGAIADRARAAALLGDAFAWVAPSTGRLAVNGVAEVAWLVEGVAEGTPLELRVELPSALRFIAAGDAELDDDLGAATWQRVYSADDRRFAALLRLAAATGSYQLEVTLSRLENGQRLVLNSSRLALEVDDSFAAARDRLLAALADFQSNRHDKGARYDQLDADKILEHLDQALQNDPASAGEDDLEEAIGSLVDAVYELDKKALEPAPLVRRVGDVLRFYQAALDRLRADSGADDDD